MSKDKASCVHDELISFFAHTEIPTLKRQFKQVFRAATFESDLSLDNDGKNSLYSLYHLIEILDSNT